MFAKNPPIAHPTKTLLQLFMSKSLAYMIALNVTTSNREQKKTIRNKINFLPLLFQIKLLIYSYD